MPEISGKLRAMREKIYDDADIGAVRLRKNPRSRRISIRVHPIRGVTVSMPYLVPYAAGLRFFLSRREWVLGALERQRGQLAAAPSVSEEEVEMMRRQAKAVLPGRLAELAGMYGFVYGQVRIKHNSSNWGSCSARGNINLNLNLVRLPRYLSDYVMLHELCHLRHADHGPAFHALLGTLCWRHLEYLAGAGEEVPAGAGAGTDCERLLSAELRRFRLV